MIFIACRHHVSEVHITHFKKNVTGKDTVSPIEPLFNMLKDKWNEIDSEECEINRLDWDIIEGTWTEKQAIKARDFLERIIMNGDLKNSEVDIYIFFTFILVL